MNMDDLPQAKPQQDITTVEDFYCLAKDVQWHTAQKLAADGTEDWCYHEYFETGVAVAINTWSLLTENDLLPENAVKCQLLW